MALFREISNQELKENDLPSDESQWQDFALTFDGYKYCGDTSACGELANKTAKFYYEQGNLPALALGDLRACLFFEQRRMRFTGGDSQNNVYIKALIEAIRSKIQHIQPDNIGEVKRILKNARRILVLTGAGISAESGVPTFRGGGGAPVWRGMPFEQLSSAQMVKNDLPLVWEWFDYRRNIISGCAPNAAHDTLVRIEKSRAYEDFSVITQNIDGLHQAAGTESVVELHGSIWRARCLSCKNIQSLRDIPADERPPLCPVCGDSMRPDVILFGETMPMQPVYEARHKAQHADVCLVIGTSSLVMPAAELPFVARSHGARIIEINPEETGLSNQANCSLRGKAAEILPLLFPEDETVNSPLSSNQNAQPPVDETKTENQNKTENQMQQNFENHDQQDSNFMTSHSHPLRVDFLHSDNYPILNRLGLTFAPGKKQLGAISGNWDRDLSLDLSRLRDFYHATTIVSLIEDSELAELGIDDYEEECAVSGIELIRFPLTDASIPVSLKNFAELVDEIIKRLEQGKTVVVHCKGGLGRAGLTAACTVVAVSNNEISDKEAIKTVQAARAGAIETREQESFVSMFGEYWQLYRTQRASILDQQENSPKEKVLSLAWEGGGKDLLRFRLADGREFFFISGSNMVLDEDGIDTTVFYESEPVESFPAALTQLISDYQIFFVSPIFVHPEYKQEVKDYLDNLYENTTEEEQISLLRAGSFAKTPDEWLEAAERRMERHAERVVNTNEIEVNSASQPGPESMNNASEPENLETLEEVDDKYLPEIESELRKRKIIQATIGDHTFEVKNIPELYSRTLEYLVTNNYLDNVAIPVPSGKTRYFLAAEPVHPSGKSFFKAIEFGGFYLEAHNNRPTAIRQLKSFAHSLNVELELIEYQTEDNFEKAEINAENRPETARASSVSSNETKEIFKVKIDRIIIEAANIPGLYKQVLTFLDNQNLLQNAAVPFATSSSRYLIAREPVHPSGKDFFSQIEHAGFYMETNKSRQNAINHLANFIESLPLEFENLGNENLTASAAPVEVSPAESTRKQRFFGSLLGLAVCDALGTTAEFKPTDTFPKITTITGGGPFELSAGEWTDDTSMALCLTDSLIESPGYDPVDQMRRYCRWKNEGYLSSNGVAFDIGNTVRMALEKFERQTNSGEIDAYCGSVSPSAAGNGSLMRLAPIALFYADQPEKAIYYAGESSRTTHGTRECVDACRYYAGLIVGALEGKSKAEILSARYTPVTGSWEEIPLALKIAEIANGAFKSPRPPQINGLTQGYVVPSLHAALWAFYHTSDFVAGALKVVNLGYDADTYGAIYGQLAGAFYGVQSIPDNWLSILAKKDLIESMASSLYQTGSDS